MESKADKDCADEITNYVSVIFLNVLFSRLKHTLYDKELMMLMLIYHWLHTGPEVFGNQGCPLLPTFLKLFIITVPS